MTVMFRTSQSLRKYTFKKQDPVHKSSNYYFERLAMKDLQPKSPRLPKVGLLNFYDDKYGHTFQSSTANTFQG